jgi:hypothetical protein
MPGQTLREKPAHGDVEVGKDRITHEVVGLRIHVRAAIGGVDFLTPCCLPVNRASRLLIIGNGSTADKHRQP